MIEIAEEDFDSDSSSDDGGVSLKLTGSDTARYPPEAQLRPRITSGSPFHQDPNLLVVPNAQLWQFPHLGNLSFQELGADVTFQYFAKSCDLISRKWGCHPADSLPRMLQKSTPYSLALFSVLRRMSKATQDRLVAHAEVVEQWERRVGGFAKVPGRDRCFMATAVCNDDKFVSEVVESKIEENVFGLTLQDAGKALHILRQKKKLAKAERTVSRLRKRAAKEKLTKKQARKLEREEALLRQSGHHSEQPSA